jgi:hypothetical protein
MPKEHCTRNVCVIQHEQEQIGSWESECQANERGWVGCNSETNRPVVHEHG